MNCIKFLRTGFQVLAFAIFAYQMFESLNKFVKKPIMTEKLSMKFDDIQKPMLYICQDNQYDYNKARQLGYEWKIDFMAGKVNGSETPTWNGAEGNITYVEVVHMLYK